MAGASRYIIVALAVAAGIVVTQSARIIRGVPVDSLRRFPHHVSIETIGASYDAPRLCAGSILNEQWILTSALCVDGSRRLQLHFEKLYYLSSDGSYTAVVNSDAIRIYPTYYDDIALVKIPFRLIFSDTIKPVKIASISSNPLVGRLAVMPGFDVQEQWNTTTWSAPSGVTSISQTSDHQLSYGMFKILSNAQCKNVDSEFDEYLQLCTENWDNNANGSCSSDYGSGLVVGWPAKSELVGIHSVALNSCNSSTPAVYTNVAKYSSWIESIIRG